MWIGIPIPWRRGAFNFYPAIKKYFVFCFCVMRSSSEQPLANMLGAARVVTLVTEALFWPILEGAAADVLFLFLFLYRVIPYQELLAEVIRLLQRRRLTELTNIPGLGCCIGIIMLGIALTEVEPLREVAPLLHEVTPLLLVQAFRAASLTAVILHTTFLAEEDVSIHS